MRNNMVRSLALGALVSCLMAGTAFSQATGNTDPVPAPTAAPVGSPIVVAAPSAPDTAPAPLAPGFLVSPARLPDSQLRAFIATPSALLAQNPNAGEAMTSTVRALAGSSADTLPALLSLVSTATPGQLASIGRGLGRAANSAAPLNPTYAAQIQAAVLELKNPALELAFAEGTPPEQGTAALGAGGAGGGAGAGAGGIGAGGASNGGLNGTGNGDGGTESGVSSFGGNASGTRFFATAQAGGITFNSISGFTPAP